MVPSRPVRGLLGLSPALRPSPGERVSVLAAGDPSALRCRRLSALWVGERHDHGASKSRLGRVVLGPKLGLLLQLVVRPPPAQFSSSTPMARCDIYILFTARESLCPPLALACGPLRSIDDDTAAMRQLYGQQPRAYTRAGYSAATASVPQPRDALALLRTISPAIGELWQTNGNAQPLITLARHPENRWPTQSHEPGARYLRALVTSEVAQPQSAMPLYLGLALKLTVPARDTRRFRRVGVLSSRDPERALRWCFEFGFVRFKLFRPTHSP